MFVSEAGRQRWDGHMMGWSQEIIFNVFFRFSVKYQRVGWFPSPSTGQQKSWKMKTSSFGLKQSTSLQVSSKELHMRYSSSCPLLSSQPSALNSFSWPGNAVLLVYLVAVLPPSVAGAW